MLITRILLGSLFVIASSTLLAQITIQEMDGAPYSCKQLMISNSSDHLWKIEVPYKYVGKGDPRVGKRADEPLGEGSFAEWGSTEYVDVYPGANYRSLFNGPVDCKQHYDLRYSWKGYDFTGREEAAAKQAAAEQEARNRAIQDRNREYQDELKRKEQARIDEANRKKAEQAENKRLQEQRLLEIKQQQVKAESDYLYAYRHASPDNERCIIRERADITACEQFKVRLNEERARDAAAVQRQHDVDAARQKVEQDSNENVARLTSYMEAHDCSFGGGLNSSIPYPSMTSGMSQQQYQAEKKRIDALNWEAQQKFFSDLKTASDACDARHAGERALKKQQEQELLRQQEAARQQAIQAKRLAAQQKARADLDVALQKGKKVIDEAAMENKRIENENDELEKMINNMK